ncbi:MAG: DUF72 domain-containing protein [bacterium]|nr:DUF72 domain-containing protein [bacterium]
MAELHIGTSGWTHNNWRGIFYPKKVKQADYLSFYATRFRSAEIIDASHHLPKTTTFENWAAAVPNEFQFAIKANGLVPHIQKLRTTTDDWKAFLEHASALGAQLGPILLHFPPSLKANAERLAAFLDQCRASGAGRLALEFRHASWFDPDALEIALQHKAALAIASSERFPQAPGVPTADFMYLRFHGPGPLFSSRYSKDELEPWAGRIERWLDGGRDVYAYFNNDFEGNALINARQLEKMVTGVNKSAATARH